MEKHFIHNDIFGIFFCSNDPLRFEIGVHMLPTQLTLVEFLALSEKLDMMNHIGFNCGTTLVFCGHSSVFFN
jgi:hypothetical protein